MRLNVKNTLLAVLILSLVFVRFAMPQSEQNFQIVVKPSPMVVSPAWPTMVKIGPYHVKIVRVHLPPEKRGDYSAENLEIEVTPDISFPKQQETLVHEIFHACGDTTARWERIKNGQTKWKDYEPDLHMFTEHGFDDMMSPCWIGVLQENPDVVRFLTN